MVHLELYVEKPFLGKQTWNVVKVFDLEIVMVKWRNSPSLGTRGPNGVGIVRAWLSRGSPDYRLPSPLPTYSSSSSSSTVDAGECLYVRISCNLYYYAALLRRRGPQYASHSVCPSVPCADVLCLHLHRLTSAHPK